MSMYGNKKKLLFLAFDYVLRDHSGFFIPPPPPPPTPQWPMTLTDFYLRFYPLHFCPILMFEKGPVFPFSMWSAKQGNYWYHFYNVFGMTRSLTGD